ncbi:uncharacterized protein LOC121428052 [Lytechinus variegatus]|uniref:uncharacterized protein LOC121428052 n=1 Tax=Lytechinus variegatus TaxID=7654 RepID=UPI001BB25605|nr:uncharacterized protein LOC121428052 [Lytechinus variegatus]
MKTQQSLRPTPPALARYKERDSSPTPRVADRFTTMEKHRPIWSRGLTATELDRRQEQARVMNHGHQVLLESKLGKLDLREKRSVKDIRRKTENMLELLQNIQTSTPRLGPSERPGSTVATGGLRVPTPPSGDRSPRMIPSQQRVHVWEESSSSGESPEHDENSLTSRSSMQDFHLPRLKSNPATPKYNTRRRYSANDALTQSIERFNVLKSNLGRFPSSEAIEENDDFVRPHSTQRTGRESRRNSHQILQVDVDEGNYGGSRSLSSSRNDLESISSQRDQGDERRSCVSFEDQGRRLSLRQLSKGTSDDSDNDVFYGSPSNYEIDAINSANNNPSKPSTTPPISRSLSVLAPEFLPIIRVQTRSERRTDKDNDDDNENDDEDGNHIEDVSIVIPFHQKTERSLRMARRKSLAVKPATFRNLDNRRNSSPDVLVSTVALNQRLLLRSRQMPNKSLPSSPRCKRGENEDLQLKIKNFLDKTESFIQSTDRSEKDNYD